MAYVSLYRAYRPSNFDEVSGQIHVVKTLKNAIVSNKVSHAYLFSGPRGTGKTSIAKILAKAINCLDPTDGNPCNKCSICTSINENKASDIIEMDAASNSGIDDMRDLKDKVRFLPSECKYKVYIIDEAHALTTKAYNALLKTLEEPPSYVVFVLATTEPYSIPTTILSRTQIFDFKGLDMSEIENRIKFICKEEKIKITDEAIHAIALLADGGMRDALSLLDQTISYSNGNVSIDEVNKISGSIGNELLINLATAINDTNSSECLNLVDAIIKDGKEISRIISELIDFYKNILLFKSNYTSQNLLYKNESFIELANNAKVNKIHYYVDILADAQSNIKKTNQKRTFLEMSLIKMSDKNSNIHSDIVSHIESLTNRLNDIEANGIKMSDKDASVYLDIMNQVNSLNRKVDYIESNGIMKRPEANKIDLNDIEATKIESTNNGDLIKITDIELILNNTDKDSRVKIASFWPTLNTHTNNKNLLKILNACTINAFGNNTLLLSHESISTCDKLMQLETKEELLKILNNSGASITNYFVITTSIWSTIAADFKEKYKTNKKPSLNNIEINITNYKTKLEAFEPEIIRKAKEFFPNQNIEIEE